MTHIVPQPIPSVPLPPLGLTRVPPPAVLFPLRLEIRWFGKQGDTEELQVAQYEYVDTGVDLRKTKRKKESKKIAQRLSLQAWLRWYPDDCQISPFVDRIRSEETALYNALTGQTSPELRSKAWEQMVRECDVTRARHVYYSQGKSPDFIESDYPRPDPPKDPPPPAKGEAISQLLQKGAKLKALPPRIALFTIHETSGAPYSGVTLLIEVDVASSGSPTPVTMSPSDVPSARWVVDFEKAVSAGMGCRITDPGKIRQLETADWLIAVGCAASGNVVEELLRRFNAVGGLDIISPGTPTNNTEKANSAVAGDIVESGGEAEPISLADFGRTAIGDTNANVLASMLGVPTDTFAGVKNALEEDRKWQRAVNRVLWFPCTATFLHKRFRSFAGNSAQVRMLEAQFENHVLGMGGAPAIRLGKNPYGIIVTTNPAQWEPAPNPLIPDPEHPDISKGIASWMKFLESYFLSLRDRIPRLRADSSQDDYDTLVSILQEAAVSPRLDLQAFDGMILNPNVDPKKISCPFVSAKADREEQRTEICGYLDDIINQRPSRQEVPSVLERLLRLAVAAMTSFKLDELREAFEHSLGELKNGLGDGSLSVDQLELFVRATLDCFSHRLDAWVTSLALKRLDEASVSGQRRLTGVYGWLEKPGGCQGRPSSLGYFQAPSPDQARMGALLFSAGLQNNENVFQVNLSSDRSKMALWFADGLRYGYSEAELLGYLAERRLHDLSESNGPKLDQYILDLRKKYPLTGQNQVELFKHSSVLDGRKFTDGSNDDLDFVEDAHKPMIEQVRSQAKQIVDAVADLFVAEAVYQTVRDNPDRVAAVMETMEGKANPPSFEALSTPRTGHRQAQRVVYPLEFRGYQERLQNATNLNEISDITVADLLRKLLKDFDRCSPIVTVSARDSKNPGRSEFPLKMRGLLMLPIDLVKGGKQLVEKRARILIWQKFMKERRTWLLSAEQIRSTLSEAGSALLQNSGVLVWLADGSGVYFHDRIRTKEELQTELEKLSGLTPVDQKALEDLWDATQRWRFLGRDFLSAPTIEEFDELAVIGFVPDSTFGSLETKATDLLAVLKDAEALKPDDIVVPEEQKDSADDLVRARSIGVCDLLARLRSISDILDPDKEPVKRVKEVNTLLLSFLDVMGPITDKLEASLVNAQEVLYGLVGLRRTLISFSLPFPQSREYESATKARDESLDLVGKAYEALKNEAGGDVRARLIIAEKGNIGDISANEKKLYSSYAEAEEDLAAAESRQKEAWYLLHDSLKDISNLLDGVLSSIVEFRSLVGLAGKIDIETVDGKKSVVVDRTNLKEERGGATVEITDMNLLATAIQRLMAKYRELLELMLDNVITLPPFKVVEDVRRPANTTLPRFDQRFPEQQVVRAKLDRAVRMLPDLTVVSKIGIQKSFQEALSEALSRLVKPEDPAPEKIVVREWPQSNMDLHILFSPEGAQVQAGKVFAGLKIDEWTEFVPNDRETTAVGFHYESPQAEAPQAILVAVPPRYGTAEWSRDDLAGVVAGTIDLMRVRAVTSDMVAGDALGDRLPAMYFGPTTDGKTVFPYSNLVLFDGLIRGGFHYILRETD